LLQPKNLRFLSRTNLIKARYLQADEKNTMRKFILLILVLTLTTNCSSQDNLKNYYYPFSDKIETTIYKYVDKNDKNYIEYWEVTTNPKTNEIRTVSYNSEFVIYNIFQEKITDKGAELLSYSDFGLNEKGESIETKAKIIDRNVYLWNPEKEYKYSVQYINEYGKFDFTKKRIKSGFEKVILNNKEYSTIKFNDNYLINAIDIQAEYRFNQETYYAENVGMIKYIRNIPIEHKTIILELENLLSKKEFERLKASR